jgi:integrase
MSLTKRGKIWHYDFIYHGKRFQGSTEQTNKNIAKLVEAKVRSDAALEYRGINPPKSTPFHTFMTGKFLDFVRLHAVKQRTVDFYTERTRQILKYAPWKDAKLSDIDEDALALYTADRAKAVTVATVNRDLATISKALKRAYELKLIARMPRIRRLPGERVREFVLTGEMENLYLSLCPYPLKHAAILMIDCGLRPIECVRLRRDDVTSGVVTVREGKSINAARAIPLTARAQTIVEELFALWPESSWLFKGRKGHYRAASLDRLHVRVRNGEFSTPTLPVGTQPVAIMLRAVMPADAERIFPIEFVLYSCRHTYGTRLAESGATPFQIQKLMGHSSITISQKYIHVSDEHVGFAAKRAEAFSKMLRGEVHEDAPEKSRTS